MKYCPICDRHYDDQTAVCELDGAALRTAGLKQTSLVDKVIKGRYRILKKLGEGGMGTVYLADQFSINRKVALKILNPDFAKDEDFIKRFRQEATLAASLNHHNVITVFDFDQADDGSLYIVMEYVAGRSLGDVIQDNPMEVGSALQFGIQIAEGLSAAHRAGVIHRDIKPENIMVVEGGKAIKLMDFGIARLRDSAATTRLTQAGMIMGTPSYMAPEQIEGGELSERTDIYAFGIVLYEMLTGRVPFKAPTPGAVLIKHLHEVPIPLRKVRKEIPSSVERIVIQALQKNAEKRLRNMEEVVEALKKAQREVEQFGTGKRNTLVPQMAAVRRAFGAAATPFRKLLRKTGSDGAALRNEEAELNVHPSVADPQRKTPAAVDLTTRPKVDNALSTPFRESPRSPRVDSSEAHLRTQTPDRQPEPKEQARFAEAKAEMNAAPAPETIAETAALTQFIGVQEEVIEKPASLDDDPKVVDASPADKSPATVLETAPTRIAAAPAAPRRDDWGVAAARQRHAAHADRFSPSEHRITVAGDVMATSPSLSGDTIVETATFTQPVQKATTRRRPWVFAASVSGIVLLIGAVGGVTVFRYFDGPSSLPTMKTDALKGSESVALQTPNYVPTPTEETPTVEQPRMPDPPVPAAPEAKTSDIPASRRAREKQQQIAPSKPVEKRPPSSFDPAPVKRPDSKTQKEAEPLPEVKSPRPDQEQKRSTAFAEPEPTKKPTSTVKKDQEPSADPQIASLRKPEAPPPPQLKDLSIIANRRELKVKERLLLTVKGKYSDGREIDIAGGIQWKTSDSSIAFVNSRGELEALKEGSAQISATYNGVGSGVYNFNVKASEDAPQKEESGEQIKDLRRRMLR